MGIAKAETTRIGRRRRAAWLLCAVAITAGPGGFFGGCGGGDELPDDIAGVCREVAERFAEIQGSPPPSWESAEERTAAMLEIASRGDVALADLAPGAPDAPSYEAYLAERALVAERLADALAAVRERRAAPYDLARAAANEGAAKRRRLAEAAGLPECAESAGI